MFVCCCKLAGQLQIWAMKITPFDNVEFSMIPVLVLQPQWGATTFDNPLKPGLGLEPSGDPSNYENIRISSNIGGFEVALKSDDFHFPSIFTEFLDGIWNISLQGLLIVSTQVTGCKN